MIALKQKPNGIYFIDVQTPCDVSPTGYKRQRVSLDTRDKANAEMQRRDWLAGMHPKHPAQGGNVAPKGRKAQSESAVSRNSPEDGPSVALWLTKCLSDPDVWGGCKAFRTHQSNVRILSGLLEGRSMTSLTSKDMIDLRDTLRDEHNYAPASIRKLLGSLSAACRAAEDKGVIVVRPKFPKVRVDNEKDRVVSLDEEVAMFQCIAERRAKEPLRAWWHFEKLIILLLDTGFRLTEALHCNRSFVKRKRWFDVEGNAHEGIWIALPKHITKNGKARDVPCTDRVLSILDELNERSENARWFPWAIGSSGPLYLLQNIRADMKGMGFQFDDVVLHTMRHTCASRLADNGIDLVSLRDWLGHSDIKITAGRYVHRMNGHIHIGARILNAYNIGTHGTKGGKRIEDGETSSLRNHPSNGSERAESGTPLYN